MKFSITTDAVSIASTPSLDLLDLAQTQNDIISAYENLDTSIKDLHEITDVMDAINTSLHLLAIYGQSSIPQLNLDKGLENLLGIKEKMITTNMAIKSLNQEYVSATESFVETVQSVIKRVLDYVNKIVLWIRQCIAMTKGRHTEKSISLISSSQIESAQKQGILVKDGGSFIYTKRKHNVPLKTIKHVLDVRKNSFTAFMKLTHELGTLLSAHHESNSSDFDFQRFDDRCSEICSELLELSKSMQSPVTDADGTIMYRFSSVTDVAGDFRFLNDTLISCEFETGQLSRKLTDLYVKRDSYSTESRLYKSLNNYIHMVSKDLAISARISDISFRYIITIHNLARDLTGIASK